MSAGCCHQVIERCCCMAGMSRYNGGLQTQACNLSVGGSSFVQLCWSVSPWRVVAAYSPFKLRFCWYGTRRYICDGREPAVDRVLANTVLITSPRMENINVSAQEQKGEAVPLGAELQ